MLGLGAGIDYALLIVGRYREQLAAGRRASPTPRAAANRTAGTSVLAAGAIVVVAIAGLLATGIPFVGRHGRRLGDRRRRRRGRRRHPAAGADGRVRRARLRPASDPERARALAALSRAGTERITAPPVAGRDRRHRWCCSCSPPRSPTCASASPTTATTPPDTHHARGLRQARRGLRARASTARCCSPRRCPRAAAPRRPLRAPHARRSSAPTGVAARLRARTLNPRGDAATITVTPRTVAAGRAHLRARRRGCATTSSPPRPRAAGVEVYVGGATATFGGPGRQDRRAPAALHRARRRPLGPAADGGLPLGLGAARLAPRSTCSRSLAAYGVVVAVFQWGWGVEPARASTASVPIVSFVPLFMFAILFGLSMDYNVFLQSRIREEYHARGRARATACDRPLAGRADHPRGRARS